MWARCELCEWGVQSCTVAAVQRVHHPNKMMLSFVVQGVAVAQAQRPKPVETGIPLVQ